VGLWLGLTLLTNPVQGLGCMNVNKLDPLPATAFGGTPNFVTPTGTFVYYEQLGGTNSGIYFATDTVYNVIFGWTGEGVILVDCPGAWVKATIEKVIPTKNTVTHYIYSHTHQDHNNCGNLFTNATFMDMSIVKFICRKRMTLNVLSLLSVSPPTILFRLELKLSI